MTHTHSQQTTRYQLFTPSPSLAPYVSCYWVITGSNHAPASRIRVLPDGCMDIIFDLNGGLAPLGVPSPHSSRPHAFVTGASTLPTVITLPPSPRIVGVHFTPGGAPSLLKIKADELTGTSTPLDEFLPEFSRLAMSYVGEMESAESMARTIDQLLLEQASALKPTDTITAHAVGAMWRQPHSVKVKNLVRDMSVNHKRLERNVLTHVGLTPKRLSRVIRFVDAAQRLQTVPSLSLAQLATDLGYTDQAHFNREFKTMSDLTPTQWLAEQADVDFLQYTPVVLL